MKLMMEKFENSIEKMYNKYMKILLLIISLMICSTRAIYKTKATYQVLDKSIPIFKTISNVNKPIYLNMSDIQNIPKSIYLTGEIAKNHLHINFSKIENLDQLNNFNKEIKFLDETKYSFVNVVISLINNIFQSLPEQDVEISNKSNSLMSWFTNNNQNQITLSIKHEYRTTEIKFICNLSEDPKTTIIVPSFNPNEQEEENESKPLLEKK